MLVLCPEGVRRDYRADRSEKAFPGQEQHGMAFLFLNFASTYASSWLHTTLVCISPGSQFV